MSRLPIHQSLSPNPSVSSQSDEDDDSGLAHDELISLRSPSPHLAPASRTNSESRRYSFSSPQLYPQRPPLRLSKEDVLSFNIKGELVGFEHAGEDSESVSQHLLQLGNRLDLLNSTDRMTSKRTTQPAEEENDTQDSEFVAARTAQGETVWPRLSPEIRKLVQTEYSELVGPGNRPSSRQSMDGGDATAPAKRVSPEDEPVAPGFLRLLLPSETLAARTAEDVESVEAVKMLVSSLMLRQKFITKWTVFDNPAVNPPKNSQDPWASREPVFNPYSCEILPNLRGHAEFIKGVLYVYTDLETEDSNVPTPPSMPLISREDRIPDVGEYVNALREMMRVAQDPACKSLAYQRLRYLEERFSLHLLFNGTQEIVDVRSNHHRDFYNVRKVDTHVHHSACMTQKHLLRFIRKKYRDEGDSVVASYADGTPVTLAEIFLKDLGLAAWEISIDHLNVHALNSCFHRFDVFNSKYNPFGAAMLREVFLKTDNMIGGRYLAELTKEVMEDLEGAKYQHCEWRISIYGHSPGEWVKLARWLKNHQLFSRNVRWIIQVPRLYHVYRKRGALQSMKELLSNVFEPVVNAVLRPQDHPEIFEMLRQTVAWDSVDDESVVSKFTTGGGDMPPPEEWTQLENPPYAYWMYYMYANIKAVNHLLQLRGLNAMPFRPHCGEAGSISHLASAALLADGINHGLILRKSPVLQYLYYLWQIGLAMSPLSNNALFHEITKSPFNSFFRIGLNVSLSADDPLMFHFTDEALLEEYSVCAHVWKLSPVDLCEIARNSVLQSNFDPQLKRHWLGTHYYKRGPKGNDVRNSNVPDIRLFYREETLKEELKYLRDVLVGVKDAASNFTFKPSRFDPTLMKP